ncbi:MAG: hypothetical protein NTW87_20970 [Planctomycetota bacterium]|nr:hypothetical protein [Planctomycetota bacterium]
MIIGTTAAARDDLESSLDTKTAPAPCPGPRPAVLCIFPQP